MTIERERRKNYYRNLISEVDQRSLELAQGSFEAGSSLVKALGREHQDGIGTDIAEAAEHLDDLSLLALKTADQWLGNFNSNFGWEYNGPEITQDNEHLLGFLQSLGEAMQGILHEDGPHGDIVPQSLASTSRNYYNLINWVNERAGG